MILVIRESITLSIVAHDIEKKRKNGQAKNECVKIIDRKNEM